MKKLKIIGFVGLSIILISCKKNRVCSCYIGETKTLSFIIKDQNLLDAINTCDESDFTSPISPSTLSQDCKID